MRNATLLAAFCGLIALAPAADAQGCDASQPEQAGFQAVDIRDINAIPQENIDRLNAAVEAGTITIDQIQEELSNDLEGTVVEFEAVVLSDPILSGIRSAVDGIPGGIHFFVRDLSAADGDVAGQGIQVVDNRGGGEAQALRVGSVITVCARVQPFDGSGGKSMQVGGNDGVYSITQTDILDPTDPDNAALFAPVTVTTDDVHDIYNGKSILDFDQYSDFNGQYVRFEQAEVTAIADPNGARPNLLFSSAPEAADVTEVNFYDTSVCFRNDRGEDYFPPDRAPDCIDERFTPPSAGVFNIQGFLTFQGDDGGFDYSDPGAANFVVNPFEPSDFVVTEAPPTIAVTGPTSIPGPDDDVPVSATITAASGTITSAQVNYRYIVDGEEVETGSAALTNTTEDTYEGSIPAATFGDANGAYVAYSVTATDSDGVSATTEEFSYLVFEGAIDAISLIQRTFDGGFGDSPLLTGDAATFDLTATVQAVIFDGSNYQVTIQDAAEEFSGVWMFLGSEDPGLEAGDQINITEATIDEYFDLTQLTDVTFTEVGTGTPYEPIVLETSAIASGGMGEAYEGVYVEFDDVQVTSTNADAPSGPYGEFLVTSSTEAQAIRVDALSTAIDFGEDDDPATVYQVGNVLEFVRGPLYYSFDAYKVTPPSADDLGEITNVAIEDEPGAGTARIERVFPNPSAGVARVRFALDAAGDASVRLFDVTGREVATLAAGPMAAGPHTAELDVRQLAAGVYVVRLEAEGGVDTARISVVR